MPGSTPQISVIIVTHDSLPVLTGCLKALSLALEGTSSEILAVDNASQDQGLEEIARLFPHAEVISNTRNVGFARACNQAAKQAVGEYLLFLNPDVETDPGAIGNLLAVMNEHADAGIASGRLRYSDGTFQPTCRRFPTIGNTVFSRGSVLGRVLPASGALGNRYTLPDYREITEVPAVAATMAIVNRSRFNQAGGFDERFFMYMEDTDLSLRLHQLGYHNMFVPSAGGIHRWGLGSKVSPIKRACHHHVSMWKYFLKHFPNGFSVILLPLLLLVNLLLVIMLPERGSRESQR